MEEVVVVGMWGEVCLLCFILPRPSEGGERNLYRVEFTLSPADFIAFSQSKRFADVH